MDVDKYNQRWMAVSGRPFLFEKTLGSDQLLICAGDSWTWGDGLGNLNNNDSIIDDFECRTSHIYGALVSNRAGVDFVNFGMPGYANLAIVNQLFKNIVPAYQHQYQKITVVITLTEICREIMLDPIWVNQAQSFRDVNNFLLDYEKAMFATITDYKNQFPNIEVKVGRNFTYTFPENVPEFEFEQTWIDVIAEHTGQHNYPKNLRVLSGVATDPLVEYFEKNKIPTPQWKPEFVTMLSDGIDAVNWLDNSPCNYKKFTRHPNEQGHRLWADYLYQQLFEKSNSL